MNAMIQDMSWDSIGAMEGMDLSELSPEELDDIFGAGRWHDHLNTAAAVTTAAMAVAVGGRALGWW